MCFSRLCAYRELRNKLLAQTNVFKSAAISPQGIPTYRITTYFCMNYIYAYFARCNLVAKIRSQLPQECRSPSSKRHGDRKFFYLSSKCLNRNIFTHAKICSNTVGSNTVLRDRVHNSATNTCQTQPFTQPHFTPTPMRGKILRALTMQTPLTVVISL